MLDKVLSQEVKILESSISKKKTQARRSGAI